MSDWSTLKDSLNLTLRPIDAWPGKQTASRDRGPFSAPMKDTLATLRRELANLNAKQIVLQIAIREQDLRLDGLPRANAIASHPGVILAFNSKHGAMRIHFDGFSRWEQNLRAIAMHMEHLRMAALYGVGSDGQQYKGWVALPAPEPEGFESADEAAGWLQAKSGYIVTVGSSGTILDNAYRHAARKLHPDCGGTHEEFIRLQKAVDMLRGMR